MPEQYVSAITLVVPDYDLAIAFYVQKLGFDLIEDTVLSDAKRWVRVAPKGEKGFSLLLAKAANAQQEAAIGNQTGGRVGFFLSTTDFDSDFKEMTRRGVSFLETPRQEAYGKVAVFTDPFGNKWDLIEPSS